MERFDKFVGNQKQVNLPTLGKKVIIREMNGDDEDILTKVKNAKSGQTILNFLAGIIINPQLTSEDIKQWRVRDKYYLLFETVRHTYGDILTFDHVFNDGTKVTLEEDLTQFVWDYSQPFPVENKELLAFPYGEKMVGEIETSSGNIFRFDFMTSELEDIELLGDQDDRSINDILRNRNIRMINDGGGEDKIENFSAISAREMREIRTQVNELDPDWLAPIKCPHPTGGQDEVVSLFQLPDFFFPRLP